MNVNGKQLPLVSVLVPVRNEAAFIEGTLNAILRQDYPSNRLEVIVVDGCSEDATRSVLEALLAGRQGDSEAGGPIEVQVLENPQRITSAALNLGLSRARGEVVVRVDGHCEIAPNYVSACIRALSETDADCVGGPIETVGNSLAASAIAAAQSAFFGVGGVAFRTSRQAARRYVDTVPFAAYKREVFDRIGYFDEELVRNQDDEFNFRLAQAGGKILLDPAIRSRYMSRANFRGLWRQYFQYGLYKVRLIQKRRAVPSWRHLVPATFVASLCGSALLMPVTSRPLKLIGASYVSANTLASGWTARSRPKLLPLLPVAFATLHAAYGLGFLYGCWRWRRHFGRRVEQHASRAPAR